MCGCYHARHSCSYGEMVAAEPRIDCDERSGLRHFYAYPWHRAPLRRDVHHLTPTRLPAPSHAWSRPHRRMRLASPGRSVRAASPVRRGRGVAQSSFSIHRRNGTRWCRLVPLHVLCRSPYARGIHAIARAGWHHLGSWWRGQHCNRLRPFGGLRSISGGQRRHCGVRTLGVRLIVQRLRLPQVWTGVTSAGIRMLRRLAPPPRDRVALLLQRGSVLGPGRRKGGTGRSRGSEWLRCGVWRWQRIGRRRRAATPLSGGL